MSDVSTEKFRTAYDSLAWIENIAFSSSILGTPQVEWQWVHHQNGIDSTNANSFAVDQNFIDLHEIEFIAGEGFSSNPAYARNEIIVNEQFMSKQGFSDPYKLINQTFIIEGHQVRIRGIVRDFHYRDLRDPILPFLFRYVPDDFQYANLKINNAGSPHVEAGLKRIWGSLSERTFDAALLDDQIKEAYHWYYNMIKMVGFLGLLAVSISCLGLLGMVVFNVNSRVKEVGIRKVHGASTGKIVLLLSKDYIYIFLTACAIGIPITTLLFSNVMPAIQYYSAGIGAFPVIVGVLLLLILAGVTITSQTFKAAQTNPADTLKYE